MMNHITNVGQFKKNICWLLKIKFVLFLSKIKHVNNFFMLIYAKIVFILLVNINY